MEFFVKHIRAKHAMIEPKEYLCDRCGYWLKSFELFHIHQREHQDVKLYGCEIWKQ